MVPIPVLGETNLQNQFALALNNFAPLLFRCAPTAWDMQIRSAQSTVSELGAQVEYHPADEVDGRKRVLAEVARRQGQAKFRRDLLDAYQGACAITGTNVADVLQAAHIYAYNGPATNRVTNGILLRADIHNLFDLSLLTIDPGSLEVMVSQRLQGTAYWELHGRPLRLPLKPSHRPSLVALRARFAVDANGYHRSLPGIT